MELGKLRAMIDQSRGQFPDIESDEFRISAAAQAIGFFLGEKLFDRIVKPQQKLKLVDQWFLNDGQDNHASLRMSRLSLLAETLFRLHESQGFDTLLQEFYNRTNDLKSCFLEAYAAGSLANLDSNVSFKEQINTKGLDFDFHIL